MNERLQLQRSIPKCGMFMVHEKVFSGAVLYAEFNDVWFSLDSSL